MFNFLQKGGTSAAALQNMKAKRKVFAAEQERIRQIEARHAWRIRHARSSLRSSQRFCSAATAGEQEDFALTPLPAANASRPTPNSDDEDSSEGSPSDAGAEAEQAVVVAAPMK